MCISLFYNHIFFTFLPSDVSSNPAVTQGSSQLYEFSGMMKQQQQVLDLQKDLKNLRETRRISAEGIRVRDSTEDVESAYQSKIGELQSTLKNLLEQRQRLASADVRKNMI